MPSSVLIADPNCKLHDPGPGHPESPRRFDAVLGAFERAGLAQQLARREPRAIVPDDLLLVHEPAYLALAEREIRAGQSQLSTGDTNVNERSWDAALLAAGSALAAVDAVISGPVKRAFSLARPPGHHASQGRGMGFCVLNNVALAARHAQRRHGIGRVLIVDWDVHHGNGTQDVFYEDGTVFFFSTHQSPWYPGTGRASETGTGAGKETTLNCPLPAMSGRTEILGAFENQLRPRMEKFRPELVLISAGFDSRAGDPLGHFLLADDDFAELTKMVCGIAAEFAEGRVISLLEGGYNLSGLGSAAVAHVQTLISA